MIDPETRDDTPDYDDDGDVELPPDDGVFDEHAEALRKLAG